MRNEITTAFGVVRLSPRMILYLSRIDPAWQDYLYLSGKERGNEEIRRVEEMVGLLAEIYYVAGETLTEV